MSSNRQQEFQRNVKLERLLVEINGLLGPVEEQVLEHYRMPRYPVVLVMGMPRSGTTLVMQWLASSGCFAYPTNLLARFYAAPYIGARVQQLLTDPDYNFRNEFEEFSRDVSFESHLGKTQGVLAPNEFWYFWRRFFPNAEPRYVDEQDLGQVDGAGFAAELAALENVFDKPWAMKGLILELNIPFLSSLLDRALFLFIERHPFYNTQSLLEARVRFFGNRESWYSIKPREYKRLRDLTPIEQVAGQVYFTNRAIKDGLAHIDADHSLSVTYESFCAAPASVFSRITDKFARQGCPVDWEYTGPERFQHTNQVRLPDEDGRHIVAAYQRFSGERLSL